MTNTNNSLRWMSAFLGAAIYFAVLISGIILIVIGQDATTYAKIAILSTGICVEIFCAAMIVVFLFIGDKNNIQYSKKN